MIGPLAGRLSPELRNSLATAIVKGFTGIARVVVFLLVARSFGDADGDRFALAFAYVEIFRVTADLGLDTVLIRRFTIDGGRAGSLVANALVLKAVTATAAYGLALASFPGIYPEIDASGVLPALAASLWTALAVNLFNTYFQSRLRMHRVLPAHLAGGLTYLGVTLVGLRMGWGLPGIALLLPLSELGTLLVTIVLYRREAPPRTGRRPGIARALLRESLPVAVSNVLIVAYARLDQLLVGWFEGATPGAIRDYAVAFKFTEPLMLLFTSLSLSYYASLSMLWDTDRAADVRRRVGRLLVGTAALAAVLAIGLVLFRRPLVGLVPRTGEGAAAALGVLGACVFFKACNAQLTAVIYSRGRYAAITWIALHNLVLNAIVAWLAIPRIGIVGAAVAVTVTEAVNTALQGWIVRGLLRTVPLERPG